MWRRTDISHRGKQYSFDDVRITPKPVQRPIPTYVGSVERANVDKGYRGHRAANPRSVFISGQKRGVLLS